MMAPEEDRTRQETAPTEAEETAQASQENTPSAQESAEPFEELSQGTPNVPQDAPQEKTLSLEELRMLYGSGKKTGAAKKFPSKYVFIGALLGLIGCIVLMVATFASYAYPLTVIGSNRFPEGNLNIFSFIADRIERIRVLVDGLADENVETILGVFGFVQAALAVVVALMVMVSSLVHTIIAIVRFSRRRDTVCASLLGMMRWTFIAYFAYPFIVNTSGGQGDAYYSIGFAPGIGMSVGMALGLGILCAAAVCTGFAYRQDWKTLKKPWGLAAIEAVAATCSCGILCILPMYSVVTYVYTSSLISVFGAIASGSFSFSGLAFSILNLLLLVCVITAYQLLTAEAEKSWKSLVCRSAFDKTLVPAPKKKRRLRRTGPLLRPAILSVLCLISTIVLGVPSIGLGWSVQLVPQFAALTALAAAGLAAYIMWSKLSGKKDKPRTENVPAAEMKTAQ